MPQRSAADSYCDLLSSRSVLARDLPVGVRYFAEPDDTYIASFNRNSAIAAAGWGQSVVFF